MFQIVIIFLILAVCLLLLLILAIPARLQSVWNWLKALFTKRTTLAASKDALNLFLPWSGRLGRGAFSLCFIGYVAALVFLIAYQINPDDLVRLANKLAESSQRLDEKWIFLPSGAANVVLFGGEHARAAVILVVAALYFPVVFSTKRLRDLNRSGCWLLLILLPFIGGLLLVVALCILFFKAGTDGSNSFGRSPQEVYQPKASTKSTARRRRSKANSADQGDSSPFMKGFKEAVKSGAFTQNVLKLKPDYLSLALPLLAKIAASNGSLSARAKTVCNGLIRSQCPDKEVAIQMQSLFHEAANSHLTFKVYLGLFHARYWLDKEILTDTQNFLFDIATVDGEINPAAEEMLNQAAQTFRRECPRFAKYKRARAPKSPQRSSGAEAEHAAALGLEGAITPEAVDKAYRSSVQQYHPDKVAGMGELIRQVAEEQMKKINTAREHFRKKFGK